MKIKDFSHKPTLNMLEAEVIKALQSVCKKYGIECSAGGGSYTSTDYTARIKFTLPSDSKTVQAKNKQWSELYGFGRNIVGESFIFKGKVYTVTGFDPGKRAYPVVCGDTRFKRDHVKSMLKIK